MVLSVEPDAAVEHDIDAEFEFISAKLRGLVPASCCPHDAAPCLSCGLDWLVRESVAVSITPPEAEPERR